MLIADHYRMASGIDWGSITSPDDNASLRVMLSCLEPEVVAGTWLPRPVPELENRGTLVVRKTGDRQIAALSRMQHKDGFLLTTACGEPAGVFFQEADRDGLL